MIPIEIVAARSPDSTHVHTQILRASPPCVFCGAQSYSQPDTGGHLSTTEEALSQTSSIKDGEDAEATPQLAQEIEDTEMSTGVPTEDVDISAGLPEVEA